MPDDEALHAAAHSVVVEFGMERPDMVHHPRGWLVAESPYPGGGPLAQPQSEALGGAAVLACEVRFTCALRSLGGSLGESLGAAAHRGFGWHKRIVDAAAEGRIFEYNIFYL